jgi:hypothetical protein
LQRFAIFCRKVRDVGEAEAPQRRGENDAKAKTFYRASYALTVAIIATSVVAPSRSVSTRFETKTKRLTTVR